MHVKTYQATLQPLLAETEGRVAVSMTVNDLKAAQPKPPDENQVWQVEASQIVQVPTGRGSAFPMMWILWSVEKVVL